MNISIMKQPSAFLPVAMSFAALEAGGPDNVTVVVVDLKDRGSASTLPAVAPDDEPGDARHSTRRRSVSDPAFPGL